MSEPETGVVVITGARGQVGAAIARRLGPRAALALLERGKTEVATDASNPRARWFGGVDLSSEGSVDDVVARIRAELGPVRALVHTVGAYADGLTVREQSLDGARRLLEANYLSAVNMVRGLLPQLVGSQHGRIILFASADALRGRAGAAAYAASKAALLRFAEALAEEVVPLEVGVRVIVPTTIDTPANRSATPSAQFSDWVTLDQVASSVDFLLSADSAGMRFAVVPLGH